MKALENLPESLQQCQGLPTVVRGSTDFMFTSFEAMWMPRTADLAPPEYLREKYGVKLLHVRFTDASPLKITFAFPGPPPSGLRWCEALLTTDRAEIEHICNLLTDYLRRWWRRCGTFREDIKLLTFYAASCHIPELHRAIIRFLDYYYRVLSDGERRQVRRRVRREGLLRVVLTL